MKEKMRQEEKRRNSNKSRPVEWAGMTLGDFFMMSPEIRNFLGLQPQPSSNVSISNVQITTSSSSNNVSLNNVSIQTSNNNVPKTLDLLRKFNNDLENNVVINDLKDALQQRKVINNVIFGRHYLYKITNVKNNVMNVITMTYFGKTLDELTITFETDDELRLLNNIKTSNNEYEINEMLNDFYNALKNDNITTVTVNDVIRYVKTTNLIYGNKYDYVINEYQLRNENGKYELTINVTVMTKNHEKLYDVKITLDDNDLKKLGGHDE